jgi:hypothetical protein
VSFPDPCTAVPRATIERLAPKAGTAEPYKPDGSASGERFVQCTWDEPTAGEGSGRLTSRNIIVGIRLLLDGEGETGPTRAREAYKAAWDSARAGQGRTTGAPAEIRFQAPFFLAGIGDEAFARPIQSKGSLGNAGKVLVTVRLRNALVTTEFRGSTYPLDKDGFPDFAKAVPLDTQTARSGAETMARELTAALAACAACTG